MDFPRTSLDVRDGAGHVLFLTQFVCTINALNAELNPIRHLLALVGARHIVHVSRVKVNGGRYVFAG